MAFYQQIQANSLYSLKKSIGRFKFVSNKDGRIRTKRLTIFKQYKEAGQTLEWSLLYWLKELEKPFLKSSFQRLLPVNLLINLTLTGNTMEKCFLGFC